MEKSFKISVYKEGMPPFLKTVYSTEGIFIHEMKRGNRYRTEDLDKALGYFLPFSIVLMVRYLYISRAHEIPEVGLTLAVISHKHPYWNQSNGADHIMVACHDWGPTSSHLRDQTVQKLRKSTLQCEYLRRIRSFQRRNTSGDQPQDRRTYQPNRRRPPPSYRSVLAFFAGRLHGHIPISSPREMGRQRPRRGGSRAPSGGDVVRIYDEKLPVSKRLRSCKPSDR